MTKIIDISKYQSKVDYARLKADGAEGVIIRCGITYWGLQNKGIDPLFEQHYKSCKAAGLPVGAYYYSAADTVAQAQLEADQCMAILKGKQFELPVYYDVECGPRMGKCSKQQLTDICIAFCTKLEKAGYFVGVYANTNYFTNKLDHAELAKRYTIWLADYRSNPDKALKRDMWQYTSKGKLAAISGNVDVNECYRDFGVIKSGGFNGFSKAAATVTTATVSIKAGDKVKVLKAIQYDNGKSFRTWYSSYDVISVSGKRAVIGRGKVVTAAVCTDNLKKI